MHVLVTAVGNRTEHRVDLQQFSWGRIADRMCRLWQALVDTGHPGPEEPTRSEDPSLGAVTPPAGRTREEGQPQ